MCAFWAPLFILNNILIYRPFFSFSLSRSLTIIILTCNSLTLHIFASELTPSRSGRTVSNHVFFSTVQGSIHDFLTLNILYHFEPWPIVTYYFVNIPRQSPSIVRSQRWGYRRIRELVLLNTLRADRSSIYHSSHARMSQLSHLHYFKITNVSRKSTRSEQRSPGV